jgi:glycosyltransferase involved in cell wall biosynthesis
MSNKRILIFSTAYLPLVGGAELAVKNITDLIGDFDFDLITARIRRDLPKYEKIGRIGIYRTGFGYNFDKILLPFCGAIKACRLNKKNNYVAIWAIMASFGGLAALLFKSLNPKIKFLLTLQEGDDLEYIKKRAGFFFIFIKRIFTAADYIQAISNYLADWARQMGTSCLIEVVPNGVDLEIFKPKWSVENLDKKIIVTVSRLVKKNGIRYLIEAMKNIDGELWIIGDGELKSELEDLVGNLEIKERVRFFGHKEPILVSELLSQSSVFVRPSLSEGLGNAFLESMAMGVPTIGTSVGGITDFLKDNETGWLCETEDSKSIADKINYILDEMNKLEIERVVKNARNLIVEKYNWNKISGQMEEIFNNLIIFK